MAYCTSCGSWIPDDQGPSCSMCYGDIDHGYDGYYREFMDIQAQQDAERRKMEEEEYDRQFDEDFADEI